jgi:DNA-directed RNA polymerase specialized sigma24 family protein
MASGKGTTPDECATDSEVEGAIRALTDAEGLRLGKVARYRARALAGLGLGISGDDLLQDAIARTLNGDRRWRKTVTFEWHLTETMRSLANHARDELKGCAVVTATAEDQSGYLDGIPLRSCFPDGERVTATAEQLERINVRFADDDEVGLVVQGLALGMTGPEIQADLNISETQFETIMTRLRRGVDRKEGWCP